jgi:hypothetical protein
MKARANEHAPPPRITASAAAYLPAARGLLGLPVEFGEHRNLDRTRLRKDFVRADEQFLPGGQIENCNTEH